MQNRVAFSQYFLGKSCKDMPNIIFYDECLVEMVTKGCGNWRTPGDYPNGSFFEREQRPKSIMIWGEIGMHDYKSELLWFY